MDRILITFHHIHQALALPDFDGFHAQMQMFPAMPVGREQLRPSPDNPPRPSAVLVLIYPRVGSGLHLILTKRTEDLRGHSGQVSFPGGTMDEGDSTYEATALRETCEELGICDTRQIRVIGQLSNMWIPPTNFDVYPVVATMNSEPAVTPSPLEVAQVLHMPLAALLGEAAKPITRMTLRNGMTFDVPYYDVEGHVVWGATAGILSELEQRLKVVMNHKEHKDDL